MSVKEKYKFKRGMTIDQLPEEYHGVKIDDYGWRWNNQNITKEQKEDLNHLHNLRNRVKRLEMQRKRKEENKKIKRMAANRKEILDFMGLQPTKRCGNCDNHNSWRKNCNKINMKTEAGLTPLEVHADYVCRFWVAERDLAKTFSKRWYGYGMNREVKVTTIDDLVEISNFTPIEIAKLRVENAPE